MHGRVKTRYMSHFHAECEWSCVRKKTCVCVCVCARAWYTLTYIVCVYTHTNYLCSYIRKYTARTHKHTHTPGPRFDACALADLQISRTNAHIRFDLIIIAKVFLQMGLD